MVCKGINPVGARILILGLAFKENCPDLRNTRVVDIVASLKAYNADVDVHDPWVDAEQARHEYGIAMMAQPSMANYDAVIIAVGHQQFVALGTEGIRALGKASSVVYDVKYVLPREAADGRL
jgi:UDP-N-acetyl-D-galactosamine dehydrogenase